MNDTATAPGDPLDIFWFPAHPRRRPLARHRRRRPAARVRLPARDRDRDRPARLRGRAAADRAALRGTAGPTRPHWAPLTERLRFLVALRPGIVTPAMAARQATAFDRISDGRLLLNVVTGGDPSELAVDGAVPVPRRALCPVRGVPRRVALAVRRRAGGFRRSLRVHPKGHAALPPRPASPTRNCGSAAPRPPASPSRRSTSTPT